MGYCLEHYHENERDLVDSVERELMNEKNPYNQEYGEDPFVKAAKERRKAEQAKKDREAYDALRQVVAERNEAAER